jgi:aspartate/methionine/tyrosine aminotransferase
MLEFGAEALVINSFSKYFSMVGWRLGWLLVPPQQIARARAYMGNMFLTAPSLSQHAGLVALDSHEELQKHVAMYAKNRQLLLAALPALGLADIAPPDGAFYIYADIQRFTNNSLSFCEDVLRNTGVATAPGIDFDPVAGRHFMRFSFAVATAQVEDAIERLRPYFATRASGG